MELCAGTAALTYHMLGAKGYQIVPFQGGKHRYRRALRERLARAGFEGSPAVVELSDVGFWGDAHRDILCPIRRARVIEWLRAFVRFDPRAYCSALHTRPPSEGCRATAEFLYLSRLAWSGKAVGCNGVWKSPGLNTTSAYGLPGTDRFSVVRPMIPSLIRTLGKLDMAPAEHRIRRGLARPPDGFKWRTACYIDPPYRDTTSYPDGHMGRAEVVDLALSWEAAGAFVMVSEGEAVEELTRLGWTATELKKPKPKKTAQYRGKQAEWITISR